MPLFMDRHDVPGATAKDVAAAHMSDVEMSQKYSVQFLSYWFDADAGGVFCFAKAPSRDALETVHRESHGLIPNEIIDVKEDDVVRFLGRIHDPKDETEVTSPLRTILFTDLEGSTQILRSVGDEVFMSLLSEHDTIIRRSLIHCRGREVKHTGDGIMAAFDDVMKALQCAAEIQRGFAERARADGSPELRVRIGMAMGRPVDRDDDIYGSAVVLASRICDSATGGQVLTSDAVRDLAEDSEFHFRDMGPRSLKGFADPVPLFEMVTFLRSGGTAPAPEEPASPASAQAEPGPAERSRGRFRQWLDRTLGRD